MKPHQPSDPASALDTLFAQARQAASQADFSREEHAFETRLLARIDAETSRGLGSEVFTRFVWKWLVFSSALVGFLFFWMSATGNFSIEGPDATWALWGGADVSINLVPF